MEDTSDFATPNIPSVVALELVNFCNSRCVFCPLFQGEHPMDVSVRPPAVMSLQLFHKLIDEIGTWQTMPATIYLNMHGEPLLDNGLIQKLNLMKITGLCSAVDIQTNGEFLNEEVARAIVESGVRRVTVGFDGASREIYEKHRVGCHYHVVLKNLRSFVRIRDSLKGLTRVAIQYVRTRKNEHEVLQAYNLFSRILNPDLDCFQDIISTNWGCEDLNADDNILRKTRQDHDSASYCQLLDTHLIVLVDGSVAACCWDYNLSVFGGPVGDTKTRTLLEVWHGERLERLRTRMRGEGLHGKPLKCRSCPSIYPSVSYHEEFLPVIEASRAQVSESGYTYSFATSKGLMSRIRSALTRTHRSTK